MPEPDPAMVAAADLIAEMERFAAMQKDARDELLTQLVFVPRPARKEFPPAVHIASAEGQAFFRGLNHGRGLVDDVDAAVRDIGKDPADAEVRYEARLKALEANVDANAEEPSNQNESRE